ncbi:MAG: FecR domain-containing protein [Elusimicrobia bacterium]|nr:FecR domain-containing protein [Elusimicrobiota bacterium]
MNHRLVLLGILLFAAPARAQFAKIGAAAAVRGQVVALAPVQGAVGRVMESGKEVFLRDKVTTDAQGRMQVMLLDETVFTIGPNTSMVLDEFVYDPATGAGKVTARVTKGVFRFVTGKIARETPSNMKVKLPVGVIGIRGTIVAGVADDNKSTVLLMGPGAQNNAGAPAGSFGLSNAGVEKTADRAGSLISAEKGQVPSDPVLATPEQIAAITGPLAPKSDEKSNDTGGGGGSASSDQSAPSEASGQATAGALGDVSDTQSVSEVTQDNSAITDTASQTVQNSASAVADGISKWADLQNWSGATAHYDSVIGNVGTCSGGVCGGSTSLSFSPCFYLNYASKIIENASEVTIFGGSFSDSLVFSGNYSFSSLSGDAVVTIGAPGGPSYSCFTGGCTFSGTTLTFKNSGGVPAAAMEVNVTYSNGGGVSASAQGSIPKN